jgi:predicted PurR-regulated permease PerM
MMSHSNGLGPTLTTETEPPAPFRLPAWPPQQVVWATLVVLVIILAFWLLVREQIVLFSLFQAIVISTAIGPAVEWLNRRGLPRAGGVVVVYLALLAVAVVVVLLVVPLIAEQGATIAQRFGSLYGDFLDTVRLSPSRLIRRLAWRLPTDMPAVVPPAPADPSAEADSLDAVAQLMPVLGLAGRSLFVFVAVLLLAFYWTVERERVLRFLLLLAPMRHREGLRELYESAELKVGAYIRGIGILSLIVGGLAFASYLLLGLPYALLLGLLAGVFEAVPVIGPALGVLPAVLVAFAVDPTKALWVLVVFAVIQGLENAVLVPRVMGHTVGVSPVVTLLALVAFGALFGVAGALLAIPLAAIIQLLLDRYVLAKRPVEEAPPPGRDRLSVLRYEAQELVADVRTQLRDKSGVALDDESDAVEDAIEALAADIDSLLAREAPNDNGSGNGQAQP